MTQTVLFPFPRRGKFLLDPGVRQIALDSSISSRSCECAINLVSINPTTYQHSCREETHMFILNNLLIELIYMDLLLAMRRPQHIHKVLHEFFAVILDVFLRILADQQYLADVAFALDVAAPLLAQYPHTSFIHPQPRLFEEDGTRRTHHLNPFSSRICFSHAWQYQRNRPRPFCSLSISCSYSCRKTFGGKESGTYRFHAIANGLVASCFCARHFRYRLMGTRKSKDALLV